MKIERLSENKIRIIIDASDIRAWNVDLKNFIDNTPEAQDMFCYALKQAERDVDFYRGKSQLMVETLPLDDNGFVMMVSKLENERDVVEALAKAGKRIKQTEIKIRRRPRAHLLLRIFKFDDFESLCDGVKEIFEAYIGESRLIKYQSAFYLEMVPSDALGLFEFENILSEFSTKMLEPLALQGVLNEHGLVLMKEKAISIIAENFVK